MLDDSEPADLSREAPMSPRLWRVWAKWSKTGKNAPTEGETYHPLVCHLVDVATVAHHLWRNALPAPTRDRLTRHLQLRDEAATAMWLAFFTGLHDLGKASPGFQDQLNDTSAGPTIRGWMDEARLSFTDSCWVPHGQVSARVLGDMLQDSGVSEKLAVQIAKLVGGHHGVFPRQLDLDELKDRQQVGYGTWNNLRNDLFQALREGLRVPDAAPTGELTPADAIVFAGLVTVADWIGSNELHFPHAGRLAAAPQPMALADYAALAERRAVDALATVRMDAFAGATGVRTRRTFSELFKISQPYDAQTAVIELAEHLPSQALVILEAPMGEGKTEAALYLADAWAVTHARQGAYIALPTQATSNQMFKRVCKYLARRFAEPGYVAAHLVYGEALLDDAYQEMLELGRTVLAEASAAPAGATRAEHAAAERTEAVTEGTDANEPAATSEPLPLEHEGPVYDGPGEEAGEEGAVIAVEWFAASKRALLAPFGVGTIDQALLGVLQTKHFFVRLFGLAGKTVIVDEVHAYDTYMTALLERLLEWLGAFGVPVVLLSATLPHEKRRQLEAAYARFAGWSVPPMAPETEMDKPQDPAYPRLTWVSADGRGGRTVIPSALGRAVAVEWLNGGAPDSEEGLAALAERLHTALVDGGCAEVICNTVGRAQAVYKALTPHFRDIASDGPPELDLFHARFLRKERVERERRVLDRFGKNEAVKAGERNPLRPQRAVLVATQVIEQSLDLDFDLMVSDLAPVDLLLQRSGRLHRHRKQNDAYRPTAVASPRLLIPRPQERDGCPNFPSSDEYVYDAHFLLRTWQVLQGRERIHMPEGIEELVKGVYDSTIVCPDDVPPAVRIAWKRTRDQYERDTKQELGEARVRRVPSPKDDTIYTGHNRGLGDPDTAPPEAEETALALTRLGPPSVRVVLLPAERAQRWANAKGRPPSAEAARKLLGNSVSIAHGAVAPALIACDPPARWKKSPWLRHARLLALDANNRAIITNGGQESTKTRNYILTLDPELGVIIQPQPKADA